MQSESLVENLKARQDIGESRWQSCRII